MDAMTGKRPLDFDPTAAARPTRAKAEEAVRTLIRWIGDDPQRDGLLDTPARVLRAYDEWFSGQHQDPRDFLACTFDETAGYDEMVVLRDIPFRSCCEHHMAPITGVAHVAYLPAGRVVGISKLARVVDSVARRLQIQERMTAEIASAIDDTLRPLGVGVVVEASHACMSSRGVNKHGVSMVTSRMLGLLKTDRALRAECLAALRRRDGIPCQGSSQ